MLDIVIIGAGPIGLSCGIAARRAGLRALVIEKGALVNSLVGYPTNMEFFSTPDLLEIGGHPLPSLRYKPIREEALDYYRRVASAERLDISLYERVTGLEGRRGAFTVHTERRRLETRHVIVATGFFDQPNLMGVEGEALPHVLHYYKEPFAFAGQEVVVVGAKNSAAKAALDCHRHGARVTLVVRGAALSESVKYWIRPDLENRIREGAIRALYHTCVTRIFPEEVEVQPHGGAPTRLPAQWVLALTGYRPDYDLFARLGIDVLGDPCRTPAHTEETFETNRPGLYLAGTVCGGLNTSRWFIENARFHADRILAHIQAGR